MVANTSKTLVLWTEGEWRCEYHPGFGGEGRLEVYRGTVLVTAEATPVGPAALERSEALRRGIARPDFSR